MDCDLCTEPITGRSVDFTTVPQRAPRRYGLAGYITAVGDGFAEVIRAAAGDYRPPETYHFHEDCWDAFRAILMDKATGEALT